MATAAGYAVPLANVMTAVPPVIRGSTSVCQYCHGCPSANSTSCDSCRLTISQVTYPCTLVVPITLYGGLSQVHTILKRYKDPTYYSSGQLQLQTLAMLVHFLNLHQNCVEAAAGGPWDSITTIPSTSGRTGQHPLATLVKRSKTIGHLYVDALTLGSGTATARHASDTAFIAAGVTDRRVLLVDDTFTSGARGQSAASAIGLAGGEVAALLPIGRYFNPSWNYPVNAEWWTAQQKVPFDWGTCCVH